MGWDSTQKVMTAPANIEEIAEAFGVSSKVIGDIYLKAGENASVNPWAMYKPVRGNTAAIPMVNRPNSTGGTALYLMNLGIGDASGNPYPPRATTVQGLIDLYHDMTTPTDPRVLPEYILFGGKRANGWRYLYPRGGSYNPKEWFRVYDVFPVVNLTLQSGIGYHGSAGNPFGTFECSPSCAKSYGVFSAGQVPPRTYTTGVPEYDIVIADVNPSSNGMNYYGVLLVPVDSFGGWEDDYAARIIQQSDASTIQTIWEKKGDGAPRGKESEYLLIDPLTNSINSTWRTDLEYEVYPFLTNGLFITQSGGGRVIDIPYSDRNNSNKINNLNLYPIPGVVPQRVRFFDYAVIITIHATKCTPLGSGMTSEVYFTVENKSSSAVTLREMKMYFRKRKTTTPSARAAGEVDYTMSSNGACYRTDDSHSGVRDSTYDSFLANITNLAINGTERRPASGTMIITFPSTDLSVLWIGATQNVTTWGSVTLQFSPQPHDPTLNNV